MAAESAGFPDARPSQFEDNPWYCQPQKYAATNSSSEQQRFTSSGASYTIKYKAYARRCNGKTRIDHQIFASAEDLPGDHYVLYQVQTAGAHRKWKAHCVRNSDLDTRVCSFRLEAGEEIPIAGQSALAQYRGKGLVRYARLVHVAMKGNNRSGFQFASRIQKVVLPLRFHRQPRELWDGR